MAGEAGTNASEKRQLVTDGPERWRKQTRFESISAVKITQLPSSPPRLFGFATAANLEGKGRRDKNCTGKKRPRRSSPSRDAASRHLLVPSALFSLAS